MGASCLQIEKSKVSRPANILALNSSFHEDICAFEKDQLQRELQLHNWMADH